MSRKPRAFFAVYAKKASMVFVMRYSAAVLRRLVVAGGMLLIAGCASNSDAKLDSLRDAPLAAGTARLIVYYPGKVIGTDGALRITMNENNRQACDLRPDGYLVNDIPAQPQALAFSFCGMRGISLLHLEPTAGEKYYIRIKPYDSSLTGMLSGYASEYVPPNAPPHGGPFTIERVDEASALKELKGFVPGNSNALNVP